MKSFFASKAGIELGVLCLMAMFVYQIAGHYDLLENLVKFTQAYEEWELDEVVVTLMFLAVAMSVFSIRRWMEIRILHNTLEKRNGELKAAMEEIRSLEGFLPICSACKKIRDDKGFWLQVEQYVEDHSNARFTHSMCPDCIKAYYGEEKWYKKSDKKK